MKAYQFNNIVEYLTKKGVVFIVKTEYKNNEPYIQTIMGLTVTKKDQFYRANGKVISGNMAKLLISNA